jgi:citrate lyase subunit beta/citryl-CoA lyase
MDASSTIAQARSFLFVPGHQPQRFPKALTSGADVVILDLEDAVAPADKSSARVCIATAWPDLAAQRHRLLVRLNPHGTPFHAGDRELLASLSGLLAIMVPKAEDPQVVAGIAAALPGTSVMPMVESAEGIARLDDIARAPGVVRIGIGHIDLQADLGMSCDEDEAELAPMRFALVVASRRAGIAAPVDGVTTATSDAALITRDTLRGRRFGFSGKLYIHPAQVPHVHAAFAPDPEQIAWANRVIEALAVTGGGAFRVDGKMVDGPVIALARQLLRTAG